MKNVYISSIDSEQFTAIIRKYDPSQIIAIVDENTLPFLDRIHEITDINIDAIQIPSGEIHKNINSLAAIWKDLTDNKFRRDGLIINLGGGVITDMGGFAAATFKRGVDFINIPTSLLAMVDAAIGGKTGIDFFDFKNQIGVICNPQAVFCDTNYFGTLPHEELISGFAEVLKHGLIKNKKYWHYCTKTPFDAIKWSKVVKGSIEIKSDIVANDPHEKGERKLLNFGHTIGHAIESHCLENGQPILHGNAVAAGIIAESFLSKEKGMLSSEEFEIIETEIDKLYPRIKLSASTMDDLIERMGNDKKNNSEHINFSFLEGIGEGVFNQTAEIAEIKSALTYYF